MGVKFAGRGRLFGRVVRSGPVPKVLDAEDEESDGNDELVESSTSGFCKYIGSCLRICKFCATRQSTSGTTTDELTLPDVTPPTSPPQTGVRASFVKL